MESLMQPVSLNNFFKCYPWRVHALQLVFLAAVILILFWTVEKNLPEEQKAIKERSKK